MRELRFRALDLARGNVCHFTLDYLYERGEATGEYSFPNGWIVEQYTGLHDKNGKEIYEGDIIRMRGSMFVVDHDYIGWILINGDVGYRVSLIATSVPGIAECDIIGNIHENPELLEEQK